MQELREGVWLHGAVADGFPTVAALVFTATHAFVIDTLCSPGDMAPVCEHIARFGARRRTLVINTHHHWDHVYGNAAFPSAVLFAHESCPGLLRSHLLEEDVPPPPPEGVPIPSATFRDRVTCGDAEDPLQLLHAPGHTQDSLVALLPSTGVLFGGDAVEWPLPSFEQRGGVRAWLRTLRALKRLDFSLIVPSHGPPMDRSLLRANERYIVETSEAVEREWRRGRGRRELDLPAERFLAPGVEVDALYRAAHEANLRWLWEECELGFFDPNGMRQKE